MCVCVSFTCAEADKKTSSKVIFKLTGPITDDYKLGRTLGERGQYGFAQLATNKKTGEQLAVKVISKARFNPQHFEQFRTEIELLNNLDHKYVLKGRGVYEVIIIITMCV
jgi:serine/threonine protein kinase